MTFRKNHPRLKFEHQHVANIMEKERFEIQNVAMSLKWQLSSQKLLQIARKTGKAADQKKTTDKQNSQTISDLSLCYDLHIVIPPGTNYRKDFMAISVSTMFFSICSRGVALSIRNIHMYVCMYVYVYTYTVTYYLLVLPPRRRKL